MRPIFEATGGSSLASWAIPVAALIISLCAFVAGMLQNRRTADKGYVQELEKRIADCEADRKNLHDELSKLKERLNVAIDENVELMRKILQQRRER